MDTIPVLHHLSVIRTARRGGAIVEGAVSTFVFLLLFLGMLDFGIGFWVNNSLDNATWQGGDLLSASGTIPEAERVSEQAMPGFAQSCMKFEVVGWNTVLGTDFLSNGVELSSDTNLTPGMAVSYQVSCNWNWITPMASLVIGNGLTFEKSMNVGIR